MQNDSTSTVTINNTKTVRVTVQESDGTKIENARVLLKADTGGNLPSSDSVTIIRVTTTASISPQVRQ